MVKRLVSLEYVIKGLRKRVGEREGGGSAGGVVDFEGLIYQEEQEMIYFRYIK